MVIHIVVGGVGDDEVRLCIPDDLHQPVDLVFIRSVDQQIAHIAGNGGETAEITGCFCLCNTGNPQLLRHNYHMTHIAVGNVAYGNIVASFFAPQQRTAAADLHIVRMADDC